MQLISVVRDFDIYDRLVRKNPFYSSETKFIPFDNRLDNIGISKRYNSFLNSYDYLKPDWFIFCHEDWELKENLEERLKELDKRCLYGPVGKIAHPKTFGFWDITIGQIEETKRDGSNFRMVGLDGFNMERASTFDCQCLIVHSSIIHEYNLKFDENLFFDLYVEDFCINARERFDIPSKILQLRCRHWSPGNLSEMYIEKYSYLKRKYQGSKEYYTTTCSNTLIGK